MERRHALVIKGDLATDKHVEHNAKTPDIDLGTGVGPGLQQFGGGKIETAAESLEMAMWGEEIAQTKVDDLDVASFTDQDVLDLEVSVDNAIPMAVVQGTGDLTTELPSLLLLELAV